MTDRPVITYGVWMRGNGWLKGEGGRPLAFHEAHKSIAEDTAKRVGGEVRYIDDSLAHIENVILEQERAKRSFDLTQLWQFMKGEKR